MCHESNTTPITFIRYWPGEREGDSIAVKQSGITITNRGSTTRRNNRMTQLLIERDGEQRVVSHVEFLGWPDQGVST